MSPDCLHRNGNSAKYNAIAMPELSRFFGIVIRMFAEPGAPHQRPHFHASYQDAAAVFAIEPVDLLSGRLPRTQQRLVEAWAEIADALQAKLTVPKHIGNIACNEHLLDAIVCVLAAMDFITGRAMPPPNRCRAEQEGWIWTAKPG